MENEKTYEGILMLDNMRQKADLRPTNSTGTYPATMMALYSASGGTLQRAEFLAW